MHYSFTFPSGARRINNGQYLLFFPGIRSAERFVFIYQFFTVYFSFIPYILTLMRIMLAGIPFACDAKSSNLPMIIAFDSL
jgi:hypothetical protein